MFNIRLDTDEERISNQKVNLKNIRTIPERCLENTENKRCVEFDLKDPICVMNPKKENGENRSEEYFKRWWLRILQN